jgi:hypothetical protein
VYRTLEAFSRQPLRLLTLVVLLPLLSVIVVYFFVPRTYQSTAALWALRRYEIIGATGPESDLTSTPAQTQATALSELLQTRSFALAVAHAVNLAPTLNLTSDVLANTQKLDDALFTEISKNVTVTPQGYNLFGVGYANSNPRVAQQVVELVITNFGYQSIGISVSEGQYILANDQRELANALKEANVAAAAEAQYIAAHPHLTPQDLANDPQFALLHAQRQQAQSNVQNIQQNIATVSQAISSQGTSADNLFKTVDAPNIPTQPVSRLKLYLLSGGTGLGVAILACMLYIVIVVRRDRSLHTTHDLQKITTVPILMQSPYLAPSVVPLLVKESGQSRVLLRERKNSINGHAARRRGKNA